ncbi:DUF6249 domain-containing protein [Porphyromonas sp.]|uniref:DUF6249 domain-containing protein n=1 Tax=Porphyromonas sp. TaxID=1924944 RepID=UPI0026DD39E4|nr:DUF6249 domain-containing protein [Porphyromonas sp.]MDO4770575.1 hypothetical protein [Porphyromonas sp.]
MKEIMAISIIFIIFTCIYKIFELFVRRNERIKLIDKLSESDNPQALRDAILSKYRNRSVNNKSTIKVASLLLGMGIGLGIALFIVYLDYVYHDMNMNDIWEVSFVYRNFEMITLSSVLFFGGIGILIPSLIFYRKEEKQD